MNIIFGLALMALGILIVIKSEWMYTNFGSISFFEQHLGSSGGSRLGYKLTGILIIFIGFMIFTNMIGGFMGWILSPLFRYNQV